jgi:chromosome segregation ATPase
MKSFIGNFEKHFIKYFLRIVPNGKAELKVKIYSQKIKGITKNGYSMDMKVSFNEEEGIRRWSEFSGGQKTVLSLCIILAIQKVNVRTGNIFLFSNISFMYNQIN